MSTYSTLPYDVLHQLCIAVQLVSFKSLKSLSLVNKRMRSAAVPILFRSVAFQSGFLEEEAWERFKLSSFALMDNSELLCLVKRVSFGIHVRSPENRPVPQEFFNLLRALKNLTDLELLLQKEYIEQIRNEFGSNAAGMEPSDNKVARNSHIFSSVQSLKVTSPAWLDLSPLFPNLYGLDIHDWGGGLDYEYIARMHPQLRKLYSPEQSISTVLQKIVRHLPNIEELGLFGEIREWDSGCILDHLPSYGPLTKLRSLSLPHVSDLGLGFNTTRLLPQYMSKSEIDAELDALDRVCKGLEAAFIDTQDSHKKGALNQLRIGNPRENDDILVYLVGPSGKLEKAHEERHHHHHEEEWYID